MRIDVQIVLFLIERDYYRMVCTLRDCAPLPSMMGEEWRAHWVRYTPALVGAVFGLN